MLQLRNLSAALVVIVLAGCASAERIAQPCCYPGAATPARFDVLYLETRDGQKLPFLNVFEGFRADTGVFGLTFPIHRDIAIREVTFEPLAQVLPKYDANHNNALEEPELTVLYIQEAARGLGYDVVAMGTNPRINAIAAAPADVSGLLTFIHDFRGRLSPRARQIFADVEAVGQQQELDTPGPDNNGGVIPPGRG